LGPGVFAVAEVDPPVLLVVRVLFDLEQTALPMLPHFRSSFDGGALAVLEMPQDAVALRDQHRLVREKLDRPEDAFALADLFQSELVLFRAVDAVLGLRALVEVSSLGELFLFANEDNQGSDLLL